MPGTQWRVKDPELEPSEQAVIHVSQSREEFEGKEDSSDVHRRIRDRCRQGAVEVDLMTSIAAAPELDRPGSLVPRSSFGFQRQISGAVTGFQRQVSGPATSQCGFQRQVSGFRDDLRPRSAPSLRRKVNRDKNPFIEYDAREKRLNQERKWLQEASGFMEQRRDELRFGALMNQLNIRSDGDDRLYENRTFYGPHSVAMKARQRARAGKTEPPRVEPPKEVIQVHGRRTPKEHAHLVKRLAQDLKSSVSEETQRRFVKETVRTNPWEDLKLESTTATLLLGFRFSEAT
eukprot:s54_g24.t1